MKKIIPVLILLLLFSGCISYFESAEKTTTIEIKEEIISTELTYEGKLTEKGKEIKDCKKELKKLFPSTEASLEANINSLDKDTRDTAKAELIFLKEVKNSFQCTMEKDEYYGKLKLSFDNSREIIKELSKIKDGFALIDVNKEQFILIIEPEIKDYFSPEISKENLRIKVRGEIVEINPERYSIKDGFILFYDTKNIDANYIRIEFRKEKPADFPFLLVAAGFILLVATGVIFVVWRKRNPEELFPRLEKDIKQRMKKELTNGLATTEIQILNFEKTPLGYEAEVMIKIRKYHVVFNKKMELKNYLKIE